MSRGLSLALLVLVLVCWRRRRKPAMDPEIVKATEHARSRISAELSKARLSKARRGSSS